MFESSKAFGGVSVDDVEAARGFYGGALGFDVDDVMGGLSVALPGGSFLWVYPKPDHAPATFTVLNFPVPDVEAAVDELNARGVETRIYDREDLPTDEKGIMRGQAAGRGPDIAWFRDPAGNVLAVLGENG